MSFRRLHYTDPTGHFKWKKFWNSFAGAAVGAALVAVLGPAGYGLSFAMAGMIGGAVGGAITGGLEGGWKGALIGAGIGGALGGLGGWGFGIAQAHQMAGQYMAGMLLAGAGVAAATDSWDSFAGGLAGGIVGYGLGTGINKSIAVSRTSTAVFRQGESKVSDGDPRAALSIDKNKGVSDPILNDSKVRSGMEQAWKDSQPYTNKAHEEGGWIYKGADNKLDVIRWEAGGQDYIGPSGPRPNGAIAHFHTHPNTGPRWDPAPSVPDDINFTTNLNLRGYVVSEKTIYVIDQNSGEYKAVLNR